MIRCNEQARWRELNGSTACRGAPVAKPTRAHYHASMRTFLVWLILLIVCWPIALLALLLYPLVWLVLLPFRLVGIAVDGVFGLLRALVTLPARVLGGPPARG